MIVRTDYMGDIKYDESAIITFRDGLYGFQELKRYIIVNSDQEEFPFSWLQSVDQEEISFIMSDPFLFVDDYSFDLPDSAIERLGIESPDDAAVYSVTVVPEEIRDTTINLKAPIVINVNNNKGEQVVLSEDYPFKRVIFIK